MIQEKIPDSVMLEWLKKLRVHFGRPISSTDARLYRKKHQDTAPSVSTIIDRFGSWNAALKAAGLETCSPGATYKISKIEERKKAAIGLLKLFYKEKGRTPAASDFLYSKMHGLSYRTIADLFGGWNNALAAAGLEIGIKTKDPLSQMEWGSRQEEQMLKKILKIILITIGIFLLMFAWGAWRWMEGHDEGRQGAIVEFAKLRNIEGLSLDKAIDRIKGKKQSEFMFHCENFCQAGCISIEIEEAKKDGRAKK